MVVLVLASLQAFEGLLKTELVVRSESDLESESGLRERSDRSSR